MTASALSEPAPKVAAGTARKSIGLSPTGLDFLFLALLVWLFLVPAEGWSRLLEDGDTGWHIRAGEWILDHGTIPRQDLFSFTKSGEPWFAWEWGAEVIYGVLHRMAGLKGVVLLSGIQIALFGILMFRLALWRGANPLIAIGLTLVGAGAASVHYLARPHLFTLVLFPAALWILEADRRRQGKLVWILVPVSLVWANLHGGFLALISITALLAIGSAAEIWWSGHAKLADWQRPIRYAALTVLCGLASLANPNGVALHLHALSYLDSEWIRQAVSEFQSPNFREENVRQYEFLLLGGLTAAGALLRRGKIVEPLWILFWAHQSLGSVRHITLFVAIAVPVLAAEISSLFEMWCAAGGPRSARRALDSFSRDLTPAFSRASFWPVLIVSGLLAANVNLRWPTDFPASRFPVETVARHKGLLSTHRVYTHDEWADYLIFRNWPLQRVFVDGRSDFFGPEIGRLAQDIAQARAGWRTGLDRYGVEIVLAPPAWPLVERLRLESSWKVVEEASEAVIFQRVGRVSGNQMEWPGKILEAKANELTGSGRILLGRAPR